MIAETSVLVLAVAGTIIAAVTAIWLLRERRYRRQVRALLKRLEDVERVTPLKISMKDDLGEPKRPEQRGKRSLFDVLAGRTSFVNRVIEGQDRGSLAAQAIARVHRHLEEPVTPAQIADELYISLRALERGLRATLDCTPRQLIMAMKMREAHRRLATGRFRVSEVAYDLGFASPAHFSRRFKSFHGISPSQLATRSEHAA